jgi:hypothetical protein
MFFLNTKKFGVNTRKNKEKKKKALAFNRGCVVRQVLRLVTSLTAIFVCCTVILGS